jgi:nicotinamidase/pyrazinamidase
MQKLVAAARAAGIVHVASADDHELTDAEISDQPDFSTTYPPHCLRGTRGARKIPETEQEDPIPITLEVLPDRYLSGREFLLLKKGFDVFANPNTDRLLERLDPDEIVVFGVATDVCDDAAIRGFLERRRKVVFVEDAARGLDDGRVAACTTAWRDAGVEFTTAERVISGLSG